MNKILKEAFDYHHHFNQKLVEEFKNHPAMLDGEAFNLFCHVLNAHQIWNARMLGRETFGVLQMHDIGHCAGLDRQNYDNSILILENTDLEKVMTYQNSKGQTFSNTVRDILFHVVNHSTHHKAQIATLFRQAGLKPLISDYIFYKRS